jgi:hypothetical protein
VRVRVCLTAAIAAAWADATCGPSPSLTAWIHPSAGPLQALIITAGAQHAAREPTSGMVGRRGRMAGGGGLTVSVPGFGVVLLVQIPGFPLTGGIISQPKGYFWSTPKHKPINIIILQCYYWLSNSKREVSNTCVLTCEHTCHYM